MTSLRSRFFLVTLLVAIGAGVAHAEAPLFDDERSLTTRRAMTVLGGWAVANMAVSGPLWFATEGSVMRFHEMNVAWNLVNLGIVGVGILGDRRSPPAETLDTALAEQRRLESSLLLNIGLDVAYMAAGWALLERSARGGSDSERWSGYGASLLVQGGFLFVFDIGFLLFQQQNRPLVTGPNG